MEKSHPGRMASRLSYEELTTRLDELRDADAWPPAPIGHRAVDESLWSPKTASRQRMYLRFCAMKFWAITAFTRWCRRTSGRS